MNKKGEDALSYTDLTIVEIYGKRIKWYVDHLMDKSKICLVHCPGHTYDECKVLGNIGFKYVKGKPSNNFKNHHVTEKTFNRQQKNNTIINNVLGKILFHEIHKISAGREASKILDSDYDENYIYQVERMDLEETKEKNRTA